MLPFVKSILERSFYDFLNQINDIDFKNCFITMYFSTWLTYRYRYFLERMWLQRLETREWIIIAIVNCWIKVEQYTRINHCQFFPLYKSNVKVAFEFICGSISLKMLLQENNIQPSWTNHFWLHEKR